MHLEHNPLFNNEYHDFKRIMKYLNGSFALVLVIIIVNSIPVLTTTIT